ncbi:uncharacterized protein LOC142575192 isoform X1 [Dermacentor variabilis]|uniref:uncharacterized protein LOC142575192 isoform X1 n=1 Tax=Dermacentor variabilis TaxID=34621 RepID=UPI003F5CA497
MRRRAMKEADCGGEHSPTSEDCPSRKEADRAARSRASKHRRRRIRNTKPFQYTSDFPELPQRTRRPRQQDTRVTISYKTPDTSIATSNRFAVLLQTSHSRSRSRSRNRSRSRSASQTIRKKSSNGSLPPEAAKRSTTPEPKRPRNDKSQLASDIVDDDGRADDGARHRDGPHHGGRRRDGLARARHRVERVVPAAVPGARRARRARHAGVHAELGAPPPALPAGRVRVPGVSHRGVPALRAPPQRLEGARPVRRFLPARLPRRHGGRAEARLPAAACRQERAERLQSRVIQRLRGDAQRGRQAPRALPRGWSARGPAGGGDHVERHSGRCRTAPAGVLEASVGHLLAQHWTREGSLSDAVSEQLFGLADLLPTEEAVNAAYAPYADMRPDAFLDNWLLAIDGRRRQQRGELAAATGASHLARLVEAPFFDLGLEWLSLAGGNNDSSSAWRRGLVVRLHHIAFPMYSVNVTDALRYGTLGAQFAWALLTRFSADELASAVPSEAGCRSTWASKGWLHRIRLVRELQLRALADARGSRVEQRLAGLEHLSERALLFAVGCLLLCDGDPSDQLVALCNEPLAGDAGFAEAFDCPQRSAMTARPQHACSDSQNGGT